MHVKQEIPADTITYLHSDITHLKLQLNNQFCSAAFVCQVIHVFVFQTVNSAIVWPRRATTCTPPKKQCKIYLNIYISKHFDQLKKVREICRVFKLIYVSDLCADGKRRHGHSFLTKGEVLPSPRKEFHSSGSILVLQLYMRVIEKRLWNQVMVLHNIDYKLT